VLNRDQEAAPNTMSGSQLLAILNETFKDYSIKPEIRVLTGTPEIHDRFFVVDESVWLTGNSLNTIGERASMIVRLADPTSIIVRLQSFWERAPTLETWLPREVEASSSTGFISWLNELITRILRR